MLIHNYPPVLGLSRGDDIFFETAIYIYYKSNNKQLTNQLTLSAFQIAKTDKNEYKFIFTVGYQDPGVVISNTDITTWYLIV